MQGPIVRASLANILYGRAVGAGAVERVSNASSGAQVIEDDIGDARPVGADRRSEIRVSIIRQNESGPRMDVNPYIVAAAQAVGHAKVNGALCQLKCVVLLTIV